VTSFLPVIVLGAILGISAFLSDSAGAATLALHAPTLSVHETSYGTSSHDGVRESVEGLEIRMVSYSEPGTTYEVQCFFLKKGKQNQPATIDDTVIFHVTNPHGSYGVLAKPIKIGRDTSLGTQSSKSGKGGKNTKTQTPPNPSLEHPREGYVVRVLSDGVILRQSFSTHRVEEFVRNYPEKLEAALVKKSARHLQGSDLYKR